jgi:Xaa-Pro dipeptidase
MTVLALDPELCRARQRKLLERMAKNKIDAIVISRRDHVQYLSGVYFSHLYSASAALFADGRFLLAAPEPPPEAAAVDEVKVFGARKLSTLRDDQVAAAADVMSAAVAAVNPKKVGIELSACSRHFQTSAEPIDIEGRLLTMRRNKDTDELALIAKATAAAEKMYEAARAMIAPGVNELDVFNELQAVAVKHLGEPLTGTGNDYCCGEMGGPPRDRQIEAGEIYILDLGPVYRGYNADNCRAIAVTEPTAAQQQAWKDVVQVFDYIQSTVKPGIRCREIYAHVKEMLARATAGTFPHHLGHGIGLAPHETPRLNPNWDDTFMEGDVFTVEPGLYAPELQAGLRLENNYRVTGDGVELLTDFPLEY